MTYRKFNNRTTRYKGGHYDSALEADYAAFLDMCKNAHDPKERIIEIERQYPIRIVVNGTKICTHFVDFRVTLADGSVEFREVKGMATDVWKLKWKLVRALFPDIPYRVITRQGRDGFATYTKT